MDEELVPIKLSGKVIQIPERIFKTKDKGSARAFAVETGQATWEEMNQEPTPKGYEPDVGGNLNAAMISAGRTVGRIGSNAAQAFNELVGNDRAAAGNKADQAEAERLASPLKRDFPVSNFVGEQLPYFAVPGGKAAQLAAGAGAGALEGDSAQGRLGGAALGFGGALLGQKVGDKIGARVQNKVQQMRGNPYAAARKVLMDSKVPLNLSERTDGVVSKPLARFFERARFVLSNRQPKGEAQQKALTKLVTEALGSNDDVLTRSALGKVTKANTQVFRNAAERASKASGGKIFFNPRKALQAQNIIDDFNRVGSDSKQVEKIFSQFEDFITNPAGMDPDKFLKLRSDLSFATTKADLELSPIISAIDSMDDELATLAPDLAEDLITARDRFRLLIAVRRGAALAPNGEININTLNNNIERVFKDFDVGTPLPRGLADAGEGLASFNEISNGFRSSGTAENAASLAMTGGLQNPGIVLKTLAGMSVPFAGGGSGALLGGGAGRSAGLLAQDEFLNSPPIR